MTEIGTVIDGKYEILREIGRGGNVDSVSSNGYTSE